MLCVYKAKPGDNLDSMKHKRIHELVATSEKSYSPQIIATNFRGRKVPQFSCFPPVSSVEGNKLNAENWGGGKSSKKKCSPL